MMVNVSPIKITQKVLHDIGMHSFYWLKSFKCIPKANKTKSLVSIFLHKVLWQHAAPWIPVHHTPDGGLDS